MAHSHEVTDQDAHFLIDTDSRKVENPSGEVAIYDVTLKKNQ